MIKNTVFFTIGMLAIGMPAMAQHRGISKEGTATDIASLKPVISYNLPWKVIMEADILWKKRVWREIDVADAANTPFRTTQGSNAGLFETLAAGALSGSYRTFDADNDRFSKELKADDLSRLLSAGKKATIKKYKIKEDWLCLKKDGHVEVRILGIAPVVADGSKEEKTLCWFYYPDVRQQLAAGIVPGTETEQPASWDEIFQYRRFVAPVQKVIHRE
jgi:hypothetical protein